jgi:hypothetical protein
MNKSVEFEFKEDNMFLKDKKIRYRRHCAKACTFLISLGTVIPLLFESEHRRSGGDILHGAFGTLLIEASFMPDEIVLKY